MMPNEGGFYFYWTTSFILEGVLLEYSIRNVQLLFFTVKCFRMMIIMNLYEGNGKKNSVPSRMACHINIKRNKVDKVL